MTTTTAPTSALLQKIEDRTAVVGILGLGYVGLPLASAFLDARFPVLGFDTDPEKIESIKRGENYLKHLGDEMVTSMRDSDTFDATTDFSRIAEADAVLICVPTPLGEHHEPDLSFVEGLHPRRGARRPAGPADHSRVDHLPRDDPRPHGGHPRRGRPRAGRGRCCSPTAPSARTRAASGSPRARFPSSSAGPVRSPGKRRRSSTTPPSRACTSWSRRRSPRPPSCTRTFSGLSTSHW